MRGFIGRFLRRYGTAWWFLWSLVGFSPGCGGPPTTAHAPANAGGIVVLETPKRIANRVMLEELTGTFYSQHGDDFDMLVIWGARAFAPGNAFYLPVRNDVSGIGYQHVGRAFFNDSAAFGSNRLQGLIWMGPDWLDNPETIGPRSVLGILAQETAHRWGSTIHFQPPGAKSSSADLLGTPFHWSFFLETGGSPLGGNHWTELDDNVFRAEPVDEVAFSPIDLYLMGLLRPDQVPPLRLLVNVRSVDDPTENGFNALGGRVTHALEVLADVMEVPIDQIIEAEGLRDPQVGFNASEIRQAWVVVWGPSGISDEEMAKLVSLQQAWPDAFARMTSGRSTMVTPLMHRTAPR